MRSKIDMYSDEAEGDPTDGNGRYKITPKPVITVELFFSRLCLPVRGATDRPCALTQPAIRLPS